jgi:hypothetical protein
LRTVNATSKASAPSTRPTPLSYFAATSTAAPRSPEIDRIRNEARRDEQERTPRDTTLSGDGAEDNELSRPIAISQQSLADPERQPLRDDFRGRGQQAGLPRYGSIVGSPASNPDWGKPKRNPVRFDLPDPAPQMPSKRGRAGGYKRVRSNLANAEDENPSEEGGSSYSLLGPAPAERQQSMFQFQPNTTNAPPAAPDPYTSIKRLMSLGGNMMPSSGDLPPDAYRELDTRQVEFFDFLDSELAKIESFYRVKEEQATERLGVIREQLHIMRDCHIDELVKVKTSNIRGGTESGARLGEETNGRQSWLNIMDNALETARHGDHRKSTEEIDPSPQLSGGADGNRDYVRRSTAHEIPYRTAKSKLKAAMQEFYRGLELLKSYALLNRKAFRKLNKKFDKAADAPPTLQYMADKVNKAYFVKSHRLGDHIRAVEDLYARYFEGGNYKVATSKLRAIIDRPNDYNGAVFRNGLMAATGLWFGLAGLWSANQLLYHPNATLALHTSYLLQVSTLWLAVSTYADDTYRYMEDTFSYSC